MIDGGKSIVVNTSPWIALSACGQIELLQKLYTAVYIPCHVKEEIMAGEKQVIGVHELKTCQEVLEYLLRPLPGEQTDSV